MKYYYLDGQSLSIEDLASVAREDKPVLIAQDAKKRIKASRALIDQWVHGDETVYGVTTGFGEFSSIRIGRHDIEKLQENLIISHSAGTGDPIPYEVSRAMMVLRVNALAKGFSGIRLETLEHLIKMINAKIIPVIPSQGSVGSSGDLVQLSHLVLAMMGKGKVWVRNSNGTLSEIPAKRALQKAGLKPIRLGAKEGLALINGTQMMSSYAALALKDARVLYKVADVAAAMSVEALRGSDTPYDRRIHKLRPYKGQQAVAENLRNLMKGSEIRESHRYNDSRVQDAYSLRCVPQVHGASRDAIEYAWNVLSIEINSANDNPLIFAQEEDHLEGGNFHGQPVALAMDFFAIAVAELANISERRIERLMNGSLSGLPRFLTTDGGLNSGLMIAQYTAASLVSENKVLCHPASVDSIPTSANQEDHNSMGSISAQKARRVLKNAQNVIGIELLCAAQALDFARTLSNNHGVKAGEGVEAAYASIRKGIDHLDKDRILHDDIQKAKKIVVEGKILSDIEKKIGKLV